MPQAFEHGNDIRARGQMMLAASMGATAFQKGLGVNHAIAHALGALHNIHHGLANAVVLGEVMKFNLKVKEVAQKLASIACYFYPKIKETTGVAVVQEIDSFLRRLEIPTHLSSIGITQKDLPEIEKYALSDPLAALNPRPVGTGDIVNILTPLIKR
jgi:alcohol dehydrogenase class IV